MSKLAITALVIVAGVVVVQGSLFGPGGPFGQPAAPPAFGPGGFGQPGAFFPFGFGYQQVAPAYPQAFVPQVLPAGLVPVPYSTAFSRALVSPVPAAVPAGPGLFRPKPSPVLQRLQQRVLPEDLQERLNQLLVAYEEGNAACDKLNTGFASAGNYRRCVVFNKVAVEQAATAVETEANNRAATAVVEESTTEEVAVVDEAEVDVAEVADQTDNVEETVVEEDVVADAEHVDVEESTTVA